MTPKREHGSSSRSRGKRLVASPPHASESKTKAQFDRSKFTSPKDHERYTTHFLPKKVLIRRDIDFGQLAVFRFHNFSHVWVGYRL